MCLSISVSTSGHCRDPGESLDKLELVVVVVVVVGVVTINPSNVCHCEHQG